ncbi:MAG: NAD-dependent epimerase/dehydratase family protein [Sneathiellaceae bacterium]
MTVLVTGVAGFIGYHLSEALLAAGRPVLGIDNLNAYYDVTLKQARLDRLARHPGFRFHRMDIAAADGFAGLPACDPPVSDIVHLAAQAGVRYSIENPMAYVQANLVGHTAVLEYARHLPGLRQLVYASSSSVYGGNTKLPFSESDPVDRPVSLYAATKKADELISYAYAHLYGIPQTGLRFFTVYGPWGRPDMALFIFTRAILRGEPIKVFNHGRMERDFTYVDDIVRGIAGVLERPPEGGAAPGGEGPDGQGADGQGAEPGAVPHRVYNIGNSRPEPLMRMIGLLEEALGREAVKEFLPMQPGDVAATSADTAAIERDIGFRQTTPIEVGIPRFVAWYRDFYGV